MVEVLSFISSDQKDILVKARLSKSMVKDNHQQPVIKMKIMAKRQCSGCGFHAVKLSACSACKVVFYCGRDCQKRHWKRHKQVCGSMMGRAGEVVAPRPSNEIIKKMKKKSKYNDDTVSSDNICRSCKKNPDDDGGDAALCIVCGTFVCCGPCFGRPEFNGINGIVSVLSITCETCRHKMKHKNKGALTPGTTLRHLLHKKTTGRHVNHTRLILAQWMLNDTEELTGIEQDVAAAMDEYLWLANDCDYAPAQFVLGSFYDPSRIQGLEC